ncbi:transporter substrate-binding domain-containing protein [Vogesella alkaliphila]|uniref:ABC transporter substrate-binding protein n=1 Tax=Vogesella alkaliphila TaxID=1193621 RepID=A0ABQ2YGU3_9NEIS|nr:transporter substrate-binding domain-containing protein [Vogesella alkaliphila]GGX83131.1 ABC transporter substrate-binding protein [Vogesella alkaliphila]
MKLKHLILTASLLAPFATHAADKLVIATDATYPPFEYVDASGKVAGFEVDFAYALCKAMATPCEVINQPWDGLIPGLQAKKYDAIMSSMNITDERRKVVDFSKVYYLMQNRFVGRKGVQLSADLKGKTIAVQTGTPQDRFVSQHFKSASIKRYVNAQDPMLELTSGRADFTFGNTVQLQKGFLDTANGKAFAFSGPVFDGRKDKLLGEGVAVALRKQDGELKQRFNKAIDQVKASGEYAALLKKHQLDGLLED